MLDRSPATGRHAMRMRPPYLATRLRSLLRFRPNSGRELVIIHRRQRVSRFREENGGFQPFQTPAVSRGIAVVSRKKDVQPITWRVSRDTAFILLSLHFSPSPVTGRSWTTSAGSSDACIPGSIPPLSGIARAHGICLPWRRIGFAIT